MNRRSFREALKREGLPLLGLLALGVMLPLAVSLVAGAAEIPRNDDWVYRRIALDLAGRGVLDLHNVTAIVVGQILLVQPLLWISGMEPWAFTAYGVLSATAGVIAVYGLGRQFLSPTRAALATSLLLLYPGYLAFATSFMTDVSALAAEAVCLALGVVALRRRRPVRGRWLLASAVAGCFAFSIREFAVAAPVCVLSAAVVADPRRLRLWVLAAAIASCFGLLVLLARSSPPGQDLGGGTALGVYELTQAVSTVALVLAPAAIIGAVRWRHHWHRVDLALGTELGLLLTGGRLLLWFLNPITSPTILGNLASQWGSLARAASIGDRPPVIDDVSWAVVNGAGLLASVLVLAVGAGIIGVHLRRLNSVPSELLRRLGAPIGILVLYSLAVMVGLSAYGVVGHPLFDRYFWPLVGPAATLFLYVPKGLGPNAARDFRLTRTLSAFAFAVITMVASFSIALMLNSFAFDVSRWRAGDRLVQLGARPQQVDAGYEWVGFHAPTLSITSARGSGLIWYETLWASFRACGIVSSDSTAPAGTNLVATADYSLYLVAGPIERLYLYLATGRDCLVR